MLDMKNIWHDHHSFIQMWQPAVDMQFYKTWVVQVYMYQCVNRKLGLLQLTSTLAQ